MGMADRTENRHIPLLREPAGGVAGGAKGDHSIGQGLTNSMLNQKTER